MENILRGPSSLGSEILHAKFQNSVIYLQCSVCGVVNIPQDHKAITQIEKKI